MFLQPLFVERIPITSQHNLKVKRAKSWRCWCLVDNCLHLKAFGGNVQCSFHAQIKNLPFMAAVYVLFASYVCRKSVIPTTSQKRLSCQKSKQRAKILKRDWFLCFLLEFATNNRSKIFHFNISIRVPNIIFDALTCFYM